MLLRAFCLFCALTPLANSQNQPAPTAPEDARAIMTRVAANMESSADARRHYVYQQKVKGRIVQTNGRPARQETRIYQAVPGPDRTDKKLVSLEGEYHKSKNEIIRYTEPGFKKGGLDLDGELMEDLIDDLVNDKKSRDGIPHSLFPLATKDLPAYKFTLVETKDYKGRRTHRIAFEPATKPENCVNIGKSDEDDCATKPWKGEALIDAEEYQPVTIYTDLTFKMPWGVKVFLGTDLRQTGFSVSYTRVAPNVWFPSSYGTEFRLDVFFRYKRVITIAMESADFRKTDASSEIKYETEKD
jgi:hypothetical protein